MLKEKLLLFTTLVLYFTSPYKYNYPICFIGLCLFAVFFFLTLRASHFTIASFNVLFSLTFLGVTYLYPVFVYPIFPTFSVFSIGSINENVITKATMLATLAYSFYSFFYIYAIKKYPLRDSFSKNRLLNKNSIFKVRFLLIIFYCTFLVIGGLDIFYSDYSNQTVVVNPVAAFLYVFFISFILFACIANRNIDNKLLYVIVLLITFSIVVTGSRTLPLRILSILFVFFVDKYKLSKKQVLVLVSVGFLLMSFVGSNRSSSTLDKGDLGAVTSAVDLIVCSRAYYEIYDYVSQNGITYGISSTANILAVMPFAQSAFSKIFSIPERNMRSDTFATYLVLEDSDSGLGLGTHITGDTYLAFGLLGTLLLFSLLGFYIVKLRFYTYSVGKWKSTIVYFTMISCAIFMTRSSFFLGVKDIVWIICIAFFFRSSMRKSEYKHNLQ